MVWRAAAAVELGICDVVLCAIPARYITATSEKKPKPLVDAVFFGASSNQFGSPQAEFEIPYGNLGQNGPYGQVAQRYASVYGRRACDGQDRGGPALQRKTTPRARSGETRR